MIGVTVLIRAYESADLVEAAARSALMQKGVDVSVVVFDDSASNAVEDRLRGPELDCVGYVRHKRTGRPVDNWNDALASVATGHVVLLHQDECFTHPRALVDGIIALKRWSANVYV